MAKTVNFLKFQLMEIAILKKKIIVGENQNICFKISTTFILPWSEEKKLHL